MWVWLLLIIHEYWVRGARALVKNNRRKEEVTETETKRNENEKENSNKKK